MKPRLLHNLFYCFLFICFTSCVSKKKYVELKTQNVKTSDDNKKNTANLNKAIMLSDSLKVELVKKDSIIDSLNAKIADFQIKKDNAKTVN